MAEKVEANKKEKIITVPLRKVYKKSERKRGAYTPRYLRDFIKKSTKVINVKLGAELNKALWARSIRRPPRSVRVKVLIEAGTAKVELVGYEYKEFKAKPKEERKGAKEKLMGRLGPKAAQKQEEEKKIEGEKSPEKAHDHQHDSKEEINK
ncbi:MAG: hypothetical protein NT120_03270 [Candidatus Aenigmarchaeota archaeon]|nr:hypothetical protein [Candidatus Aenigmarchaeota archaeon]